MRFDVDVETGSDAEVLTFDFPSVDGKQALLRLRWGTAVVPLSIRVP